MKGQIVLQSPALNRKQPLLGENESPALGKDDRRRVGEVAGRTTAECAAVCCCCPCAVMNLLVLAVYKVPTGLCRKAWNKKKRQRLIKKKKAMLQQHQQQGPTQGFDEWDIDRLGSDFDRVSGKEPAMAVEFETEMWDRFYGAGFWRSPSQREV